MPSATIIEAVGLAIFVIVCTVLWLYRCKLFGTGCGSPSPSPNSTSPSPSPNSTSLSPSPSTFPSTSPSLSPSPSPDSTSLSPSPSTFPSTSLSPSPSTFPSTSLSPSPSTFLSPSPRISPSPFLSPSPRISPSPFLSPSPSPSPARPSPSPSPSPARPSPSPSPSPVRPSPSPSPSPARPSPSPSPVRPSPSPSPVRPSTGPAIGTYNDPIYGASIIISTGRTIQLIDPRQVYGSAVSGTMINITPTSFQVPDRPPFTYDTNTITYYDTVFTFSPCPLTCTDSDLILARNYYNNRSGYAGIYTMEPTGGTKSSDTTCLINYNWRNLTNFAIGTDTQIFTYGGTGCSKDVISITRP